MIRHAHEKQHQLMEGKKAKILVGAAIAVLLILILILYLCFKLSKPFYLSTTVIFAAVLVIAILILLHHTIIARRRIEAMARRSGLYGEELRVEYSFFRKVAGLPTKFSYESLAAATDNFQCVIGRGSSGMVFKGILDDGTSVAVKRIDGPEHMDKEFKSEVAAIASVQHINLVHLLGFCLVPHGPRFLVYDYMDNGSLDKWIFMRGRDGDGHRRCLPWELRHRVAIDVAKALAYLHHDCRAKVLHLDVKPENILLDEQFRALLSDFGLSKLMGRDQSRVMTTVRGTRGYLAPEWLLGVGITEKSDIYSYGMVLLEIVGGRRNLRAEQGSNGSRRWSYFPKIVAEKVREGRVMEVVDARLMTAGGVDEAQVKTLVHVALWCIQEEARIRPSIARVVHMLEGRIAAEEPPVSDMIMVDLLALDQTFGEHGPLGMLGSSLGRPDGQHVPSAVSHSIDLSYLSGR